MTTQHASNRDCSCGPVANKPLEATRPLDSVGCLVIGAGKHMMEAHIKPSYAAGDSHIAAIFDPNPESTQRAIECGSSATTSVANLTALLRRPESVVLIGSPDEHHFDALSEAVQAGKHVMVEKPLATTMEELAKLWVALRAAKQSGLVVSSCHPRRFDPPFMWVRDELPQLVSQYGAVLHIGFDFSYHQPTKEWKSERGLLLDHANHEIDLMHFLVGRSGFAAVKLVDSFDAYRVAGMRDDKITFDFGGTRRLAERIYREELTVRFERAELRIESSNGAATIIDHETGREITFSIPKTDYQKRGDAVMKNFLNATRGGPSYLTTDDLWINTAFSVVLSNLNSWRTGASMPSAKPDTYWGVDAS